MSGDGRMAQDAQFWEISGERPCAISGDGRQARNVWRQDLPGWWWVGLGVLGPFEDSPYRGRELLIWGKERRSFDALHKSYNIHKPYKIHALIYVRATPSTQAIQDTQATP